MQSKRQPIIAQASAIGKSGIGVLRISGENLRPLIKGLTDKNIMPRQATLIRLKDDKHQIIDQGLLLYFCAPHSFTGEDVIEFHGHGGIMVMNLVLTRMLEIGKSINLRLANPGEFSERAFLNNKIDLAQAEAIADLIEANSLAAVRSANRSLSGAFSEKIHQLVDDLTHLRILVEATLDFPEEEIEFLENANAKEQWGTIQENLHSILRSSEQGAILRNGAFIVLAGEPNVGKSSLLNQLAQQDLAIVTEIAGTTRDQIKELIQIDGVPIYVVDTAGLRESTDTVERLGIERSWAAIEDADVILFIRDLSRGDSEQSNQLFLEVQQVLQKSARQHQKIIEVWNKADQARGNPSNTQLCISAKTGAGIEELKQKILHSIGWESYSENTILARQRHIDALKLALNHVNLAQSYLSQGNKTLELFAEELRLAQDELGQITGQLLPDDLLGKIFSSFCIGK
jgi:tRNA modification GTPase